MTSQEADNTIAVQTVFDLTPSTPNQIVPYNDRRVALFIMSAGGSSRFGIQGAALPGVGNVGLPGFVTVAGTNSVGVNELEHGALARYQWFGYSQFADTVTVIEVLRK